MSSSAESLRRNAGMSRRGAELVLGGVMEVAFCLLEVIPFRQSGARLAWKGKPPEWSNHRRGESGRNLEGRRHDFCSDGCLRKWTSAETANVDGLSQRRGRAANLDPCAVCHASQFEILPMCALCWSTVWQAEKVNRHRDRFDTLAYEKRLAALT